jgi:oligopeptidase A
MTNPLLEQAGLPAFSVIRSEHVEPAIDRLLADNRARIAELLDGEQAPTWANLVQPIELLDDRLGRAWSPVGHLNSVMDTPELRAAYNACLPKLSAYHTELGHNHRLYLAYKAVAEDGEGLNAAQRKLLENALRDFHLSGVDLPPQRKARFKEISQRLSQLSSRFQENVLDANHAWSKRVEDVSALAGLPDSALDLMRQTAAEREQDGWLLTLDFPLYYPVVTYADDRELRREVYEAYVTRASERGPHGGQWDNGPVMEEILALRHEMAGLLGFANYAELSLATKMAGDTAQVLDFLRDLARRSRAQGERELAELQQFALEQGGPSPLESWDVSYYSEKLRQARYSISQEELRPYFPAPRVIDGLFAVAHRLFGIRITQVQGVDTWHPDVGFYEIRDRDGLLRGQFYLDLYARAHKRGGAWMDGCTDRLFTDDCDQLPAAYLTCNFTPPVGERPSLLTHDEVQTLFHEFGHGLHHMLTRVDYPAVGGINGVAWDAVELPSQLLENWCWEKPALDLIAGHWESGAPLPEELYQRMRAAKNFQSAMQMLRQLEFALFDFRLHLEYDPATGPGIYMLLQQVRDEIAVLRPPEFNRFPHSFGHVFSGGYAAGYYSYKWAEVLSADAFSLFEERGVFDPGAGRSFMENVLERGGSAEPGELFRAFRGRDPSIEPLLRHSGIAP